MVFQKVDKFRKSHPHRDLEFQRFIESHFKEFQNISERESRSVPETGSESFREIQKTIDTCTCLASYWESYTEYCLKSLRGETMDAEIFLTH